MTVFPKTPTAVGTISSALNRKNVLFASLSSEDIQRVIERMEPAAVPAGVTLITQGDAATEFFVIQSGTMDVYVDGAKVRGTPRPVSVFVTTDGNPAFVVYEQHQ